MIPIAVHVAEAETSEGIEPRPVVVIDYKADPLEPAARRAVFTLADARRFALALLTAAQAAEDGKRGTANGRIIPVR